jgi:hypothetical protein
VNKFIPVHLFGWQIRHSSEDFAGLCFGTFEVFYFHFEFAESTHISPKLMVFV